MDSLIESFFDKVRNTEIEIYNEFSLQHELGVFLRLHIPNKKVQFERNVSHFNLDKSKFEKKEIDIAIYSEPTTDLDCVLELKYPRNGQRPESMYSFCKDISFLEQMVSSGFKNGYFIAVVDDPLFYSGNTTGIYGLFRSDHPITGTITKPTGSKDTSVTILGAYTADWISINEQSKYCVIKVHG